MLMGDILELNATRYPDKVALITDDGVEFTFTQLRDRANRLGNALTGLAGTGDRIAILAENVIEYVDAYYGVPSANMALVFLNYRLNPHELAWIVNDANAKVLMVERHYLDAMLAVRDQFPKVEHIVVIGDASGLSGVSSYDALVAAASTAPLPRPTEDDIAWQLYTSGTTGRPKGAMLSHRSLITALLNAIIAYEVRPTDTHLYSFPMCHVAGYLITQHHLMGGSVVLQRAFEAGKWLERVEKYGCTTGGLAPTMMNFVLQHPKLNEHNTDSMRSLLYGAAAMPVELLKRAIERFGPVVCSGFGMTELGGNVLYHPKSDHVRATKGEEHLLAACGIPMAFAAVKVVDENMNECAPREVGEIVVKGEQLLKGYWNRPEATEEAFKGGWFHTGDMAWRDEEGFFYIVDRMKDMIITGGENVYSREVEEVIYVHPGVSEAAIIGLPDEVWGERVVAVVAMKQGIEGGDAVAAEIIKTCRERLAGYKCPKQVFFIGELPKNVSGKILKRELRDQFAG